MDILDDMGASKLSAKVFFKSELTPLIKRRKWLHTPQVKHMFQSAHVNQILRYCIKHSR